MTDNQDRLERAAAFVTQLHRLSTKTPHSWRRAESVGRDVDLAGAHLEQAIGDAEKAVSYSGGLTTRASSF